MRSWRWRCSLTVSCTLSTPQITSWSSRASRCVPTLSICLSVCLFVCVLALIPHRSADRGDPAHRNFAHHECAADTPRGQGHNGHLSRHPHRSHHHCEVYDPPTRALLCLYLCFVFCVVLLLYMCVCLTLCATHSDHEGTSTHRRDYDSDSAEPTREGKSMSRHQDRCSSHCWYALTLSRPAHL